MKKLAFLLSIGLLLGACSEEEAAPVTEEKAPAEEVESAEKAEEPVAEPEIDTSVFEYAKGTEVKNAIDLNSHVTVFVDMSEETKPGLATQHVVNQTYDFIQQPDLEGAKTVAIAVRQGGSKIAQFTVNKEAFKPDENVPMSKVVLAASEIDMMVDEVKEYGSAMGTW